MATPATMVPTIASFSIIARSIGKWLARPYRGRSKQLNSPEQLTGRRDGTAVLEPLSRNRRGRSARPGCVAELDVAAAGANSRSFGTSRASFCSISAPGLCGEGIRIMKQAHIMQWR